MTKLEEAAMERADHVCRHDIDSIRYMHRDPYTIARADFIAGAMWLLEEARKKEYLVKSIDTDGAPCEIDGLTRISYLEKLCEEE